MARKSATTVCIWQETQSQVGNLENFIVGKRKAQFRHTLMGGCGPGEAGGGLMSSQHPRQTSWMQGHNLGKLAVIDPVLAVWGQFLQRLWFAFLDWLLPIVG